MKRLAWALGAAGFAFALLLLHADPAAAFRLLRIDHDPCGSAQNLFWGQAASAVSTDLLSGPDANNVLRGLDTWNQKVARFRFRSGAGDRCNQDDGVVGVGFNATDCNNRSLGAALGVTVSVFRTDSGELVDGNITFNPTAPALNDPAIFLQAAMHELGHVLGLDHSDTCGATGAGTLMKSIIILNEPRLDAPQGDDVNGANLIYGGGDQPPEIPEGANSCALATRSGYAVPLSLTLAAVALFYRRRSATTRASRACRAAAQL